MMWRLVIALSPAKNILISTSDDCLSHSCQAPQLQDWLHPPDHLPVGTGRSLGGSQGLPLCRLNKGLALSFPSQESVPAPEHLSDSSLNSLPVIHIFLAVMGPVSKALRQFLPQSLPSQGPKMNTAVYTWCNGR